MNSFFNYLESLKESPKEFQWSNDKTNTIINENSYIYSNILITLEDLSETIHKHHYALTANSLIELSKNYQGDPVIISSTLDLHYPKLYTSNRVHCAEL